MERGGAARLPAMRSHGLAWCASTCLHAASLPICPDELVICIVTHMPHRHGRQSRAHFSDSQIRLRHSRVVQGGAKALRKVPCLLAFRGCSLL